MNRAVSVARMQLINKWTFVGIPALIIAGSFALTYAIGLMVPNTGGTFHSGASQAVAWYFLAVGIQTLTNSFPFSQAMSVSRRTFFIGSTGLASVAALAVSLLYYVLGRVEVATNGWGLNGQLYFMGWTSGSPAIVQIMFYFLVLLALYMTGFWFATVYKRWRATGMLFAWTIIGFALVGLIGLVTWQGLWPQVGAWFVAQTPLSVSGWAALVCAVLGFGSYLTLRRATP